MQENKIRDDLAHAYYNREKDHDDDEVAFMAGWDAALAHARSQPQSPPVEQKEWPPGDRVLVLEPRFSNQERGPCFDGYNQHEGPSLDTAGKHYSLVLLSEATAREAALRELLEKAEHALCSASGAFESLYKFRGKPYDWNVDGFSLTLVQGMINEALAAIRAGREGEK